MRPLPIQQATEHDLDHDAGRDCEQRHLPALENAERQMTGDQDARYERRREIPVVEAQKFPVHGSTIMCNWRVAGWSIVCVLPEGQWITTLSTFALLPRPKC